jgi:hypothetical protein
MTQSEVTAKADNIGLVGDGEPTENAKLSFFSPLEALQGVKVHLGGGTGVVGKEGYLLGYTIDFIE